MKMLIDDIIKYATLSTVNPNAMVTELPIDNLKEFSKSRVTRSVSNNVIEITGILVEPADISLFLIGSHNFLEGTGYQLYLYRSLTATGTPISYTNAGSKSVSADQEATENDGIQYNIPIWIEDVSGEPLGSIGSFKLVISSTSMSYFQMGRLLMGNIFSVNIGASYGHSVYWKENSKQYRTEVGTLRTDMVTSSKIIDFTLGIMTEEERTKIQRALSIVGKRDEFFISVFPDDCSSLKEASYSGIVKMTKVPKFREFAPNLYNSKYTVEEI
jgi:hypothetical protein